MKKIVVLIFISLFLSGCSSVPVPYLEANKTNITNNINTIDFSKLPETTFDYTNFINKSSMDGYNYLSDKNPAFADMELSDFANYFDNNTIPDGVYYFGFESCPYCQRAVPVLNYALKEKNTYAYYVNIYKSRFDENGNKTEHGDEYYSKLQEFLKNYLEEDKIVYAPTVVFVKDNNIKQYNLGLDNDSGKAFLTKEEKIHLLDIYRKGLSKISK